MSKITKELLHELFEYNDGWLYRKVRTSNRIKLGQRAGTSESNFYISIHVCGFRERLHRLVWIMFNGDIPDGYKVDHKDNDPSNNKIENLRLATSSQNTANRRVSFVSKSGYKGVFFVPHAKKWRTQITMNRQTKSLGYFDTPEKAYEAYKLAAKEIHGEFAKY